MRWTVFISICIVYTVFSSAALKAQSLSLATDPFNEVVREGALISGHLVTGVQNRGAPGDEVKLQANIPAAWAGEIVCSRVVSVDGLYEASNEYSVENDWPGGIATLPYPTRQPDVLSGRASDAISVRVSRSNCNSEAKEATLASWGDAQSEPALLVNSFQADALFAYYNDLAPVRCMPITLEGRSAYDMRCPMVDETLAGRVDVELFRIVGGNPAPKSHLVIWLP